VRGLLRGHTAAVTELQVLPGDACCAQAFSRVTAPAPCSFADTGRRCFAALRRTALSWFACSSWCARHASLLPRKALVAYCGAAGQGGTPHLRSGADVAEHVRGARALPLPLVRDLLMPGNCWLQLCQPLRVAWKPADDCFSAAFGSTLLLVDCRAMLASAHGDDTVEVQCDVQVHRCALAAAACLLPGLTNARRILRRRLHLLFRAPWLTSAMRAR
jgi:hypothetical protein